MTHPILERVKFDQAKAAMNGIEQMNLGVATDSAYIRGAREENKYLLPIIETLVRALEASEAALKFYADSNNYRYFPATSHPECMDFVGFVEERTPGETATQALAEVQKIMGEVE